MTSTILQLEPAFVTSEGPLRAALMSTFNRTTWRNPSSQSGGHQEAKPFSSPANCIMLQLDTCCTASFVFNDIAATFSVKGMSTQLMVKTVNGTNSLDINIRTWMDYLAVMDLKWENPVQLPMNFPHPKTCQRLSSPIVGNISAKHMLPRLLNVRIGQLISSNCKNRRIRKWKWCSFRHQTLPDWAVVWAIVWVILRAGE